MALMKMETCHVAEHCRERERYAKLFRSCFKTFFMCTFNASKVSLIHFYLNGGLHAVSILKPSEWMSDLICGRFGFLKPKPNQISVFCTSLTLNVFMIIV